MIKIITDSTADLPQDYISRYHLGVIPLQVTIDNKEYSDKVNITISELYNSLRQGKEPKTSQPNPLHVFDILSKQAELGNDMVVISLSYKLSGTFQVLYLVAQEVMEKYPTVKIEIIDSRGGSGISGLMAIQAARMVEANHSFTEIVDVMNELAASAEHIFTISDLNNLIKSGRINKTSSIFANFFLIKPILHVVNGEIQLYTKARGMDNALIKLIEITKERIKEFPNQIIAIMHADDFHLANQIQELLKNKLGHDKFIVDKIGSVLGTHLGIGGVGIFFFNKKPTYYYL